MIAIIYISIEVKVAAPIKVEEKINDPIVPTSYVEKPPFPVRMKDHAKASTVVCMSNTRTPTPSQQIKVEPSISMVKNLLVDNIDGHVIISMMKLLELLNPILKINIHLLLHACCFC